MPFHKQNYFQRRTKPKGPKTNERIRASEVQVINSEGKNLGTLPTREAIEIAKTFGSEASYKFVNGVLGSFSDDSYNIKT